MHRHTLATLALAALLAPAGAAHAQSSSRMTHGETVKEGLRVLDEGKKARRDGGPSACSLLTRAEVTKATGRDPYDNPEESPIAGGTACLIGDAQLILLSGPDSWQRYENLLKGFKQDKEPRKPVSGLGDRAYLLVPAPRNSYQRENPSAILVVQRGTHTLALSQEAERGKPAESTEPALMSLMKTALAKLR